MLETNCCYNMDCLAGMKQFPDGYFDLAVVDPPYGDGGGYVFSGQYGTRFGGRFQRYMQAEPAGHGQRSTVKK